MVEPEIRTATRGEIDLMVEWAAAEGWNPGLDDAAAFQAADPAGFLIAHVDGVPAACVSVVRYSAAFGFLGFYICRPDMRGKGIGLAVWQAGMAYLTDCTTIGLDGVVDQQDNYRRSGFVYAHANRRYAGVVESVACQYADVRAPREQDLPALVDYDRRFFPANRAEFLSRWMFGAESRQVLFLVEDGTVRGYGCVRACREGHKIGPLFADTSEQAGRLFQALTNSAGSGTIILDIPEPNGAAIALAQDFDMIPVFETARMYRGPAPDLPLGSIFGITTFELG